MKKILYSIMFSSFLAHADIKINTSGVYVSENEGEGIIFVENVGTNPVILYAQEETEETIKISGESLIFVSPPVSRIAPNDKQLLRVLLKVENFDVQKIARMTLQEIPYVSDPSKNQVSFNRSYNIPVLISPKGLVEEFEPWKYIKMEKNDAGEYFIKNYSRYLIKILPSYTCIQNKKETKHNLPSPYLKPRSSMKIESCDALNINPISNEGQIFETYKIKMNN